MISRRRFFQVSGAAAIAAGADLPRALAEDKTPPALPSPISQLQSRKSEAAPISREERAARQQRARELMRENSLDAIVLMASTSLNYFTGIRWWGGERLFAFILPAKGEAFYVCPAFEEGRAREQVANAPEGDRADFRTWQEDDNPYRLLAQGLKDRGIATGNIGMEETIRFFFADGIAHAAPQATFTSATPVTAGCRMIKSPREIALMRLAAQVTLAAYEAVYRSLREGMTQGQVEELIAAAYAPNNILPFFRRAASGSK